MATLLIHLLQHLGVPSGAAMAIAIGANKLLKGGARRGRDDRSRSQGGTRGCDKPDG